MEPGKYAVSIRAVGYELPATSVDVTAQPTQLDLQVKKITSTSRLAMQLSNAELVMSVPGTSGEKLALGGCVNCHTLQRVLFSRFSADEMSQVVQRMARHTNEEVQPEQNPVLRAIRRFVPTTLSEPNASTFDYLMLENHPTIMQRLAMVEAWRLRQGR